MKGSIEIPYAIGDTVYTCEPSHEDRQVTCPECDGKKVLTVIMGNGEQYTVECACCSHGYEPARGTVKVYDRMHVPRKVTLRSVNVRGTEVDYSDSPPGSSCYRTYPCAKLFTDRAECEKECARLTEEQRKSDDETIIFNRKSKRRGMAWSVHYWRSEVARLKKELVRVEARLVVCKEKAAAKEKKK